MLSIRDVASHPFPFVHPESVDICDRAEVFDAVIGRNGKMINCDDFVSYSNDSEVRSYKHYLSLIMLLHSYVMAAC